MVLFIVYNFVFEYIYILIEAIYIYSSYVFISFFSGCTFYVTDIFLTALIPIQLNLFKQIIQRRHSSKMKNNGDNGNHPFFPGSKNSWLRKKTITKKKQIYSQQLLGTSANHIEIRLSCWQLSLIWIKDKEREQTRLRSWQEKPQVTAEWEID